MNGVKFLMLVACLYACDKPDDRYMVVSKVKSAANLATTETIIDKVVLGTQERRLLGLIKVNKAFFAAKTQAVITAGIALSELQPEDIVIDAKRIEIILPHVQVLNFSYPFSKYEIDSSITRNAFLNKVDILDHENFYMLAELDIRNNLKYTGIVSATEEKTKLLMEGMLKNLGYEEIYISFKEGEFVKEIPVDNEMEE